jgi:hypothetical protein
MTSTTASTTAVNCSEGWKLERMRGGRWGCCGLISARALFFQGFAGPTPRGCTPSSGKGNCFVQTIARRSRLSLGNPVRLVTEPVGNLLNTYLF